MKKWMTVTLAFNTDLNSKIGAILNYIRAQKNMRTSITVTQVLLQKLRQPFHLLEQVFEFTDSKPPLSEKLS